MAYDSVVDKKSWYCWKILAKGESLFRNIHDKLDLRDKTVFFLVFSVSPTFHNMVDYLYSEDISNDFYFIHLSDIDWEPPMCPS
jgi:hypothetical protein